VTVAALLQILFPALAIVLLAERRAADRRGRDEPAAPPAIEWQPWRLVRWDDETAHGDVAACRRDPVAAQRTARNQRDRTRISALVDVRDVEV
jgi:hypothetical protein